MTESTDNKYSLYSKKVWAIYALLVIILIIILATIIAQDNEERLFYSLMTVAASYVLRPSDKIISKYVLKLFGVSPPVKSDINE